MKESLLNKAKNIIMQRRNAAVMEYNEKVLSLCRKPEYDKLFKNLATLRMENAKAESMGKKGDLVTQSLLQAKIKEIEKKAGFDDLQPQFFCKKCKDEGYVDGKMCSCLKKEISAILLKDSGFENLESFESSTKTSQDPKAYEMMKNWCHSDFKKNLIFLSGPTGAGKTHLVKCMAHELMQQGKITRLATAFAINQDFVAFSKNKNEELLNKYIECEALFIDDLGTEPIYKGVTLEFWYLVINERKMRKLITVITSNLDLADLLETYEERITSRIVDRQSSITYFLDGEDRRVGIKKSAAK